MWWVEKGIGNLSMAGSVDGFHDINQVIINKTQNVSAYTSIKDYLEGDSIDTAMPLWVADSLENFANQALKGIEGISDGGNIELRELAIPYLESAVESWKKYAAQLDASYEKVEFAAHGVFDWDEMTSYVENDITITRKANWASLYINQLRLSQN